MSCTVRQRCLPTCRLTMARINETARFHGVCDAAVGPVSIVMDKLDEVQARWLSCLLEKAWTPHGWASLGELRRHECRTHSNLY